MRVWVLGMWFASVAFAAEPKWYTVHADGKVLFLATQDEKGVVTKAYPKPSRVIGTLAKDGTFTPHADLSDSDLYYPAIANVVTVRDLDKEEGETLRTALTTAKKWNVKLVPVKKDELTKIQAIEKSLQGKWKFVGGTARLGDTETAFKEVEKMPFRERLEFCAGGECKLDTDAKRVYWIDGKYLRLSLQKSEKPEDYTNKEEFDVERLSEKELVLRSVGAPFLPSVRKLPDAFGGKYEVPRVHREYRFTRVEE